MKRNAPDPLLAAVLSPDDSFRDATLRETLALATGRRRWRTTRRALGVAAVVCAAVLWLRAPLRKDVEQPAVAASVEPAPAQRLRIVHTQGTAFTKVASTSGAVRTVSSRRGAVAVIATGDRLRGVDYLTDRQLVAAFPGRRAALIAPGTPEARVVFY